MNELTLEQVREAIHDAWINVRLGPGWEARCKDLSAENVMKLLDANTAPAWTSVEDVWKEYKRFYNQRLSKVRSTQEWNNIPDFGEWLLEQEDACGT